MIQYFTQIDKYLLTGAQYSDLRNAFVDNKEVFTFLDYDTEYIDVNHLSTEFPTGRKLVSTQVACCSQNGVIYSDIPRHKPPHPVSNLFDYLGLDVRVESRTEFDRVLTIMVGAHFATAEIDFIFNGVMREVWRKNYLPHMSATKRIHFNDMIPRKGTGVHIREIVGYIDDITIKIQLNLLDTAGLMGQASYKDLLTNTGHSIDEKDLDALCLEESGLEKLPYKPIENMDKVIFEFPNSFDRYALNDLKIYSVLDKFNTQMATVEKSLGIPESWVQPPSATTGSTVSKILLRYLCAHNLVDVDYTKYKGTGSRKDLTYAITMSPRELFTKSTGTDALLVKTFGGRCHNNRPDVVRLNGVLADADEDGCYGNGQKHQLYPIGQADIMSYPLQDGVSYVTLRQWLKDNESELVPGVWTAIIDTQDNILKYKQDFFPSWITSSTNHNYLVYKKFAAKLLEIENQEDGDVDYSETDLTDEGEVKIFTRQIKCGMLTHDGLDWIQHVCSPRQRKDILDNTFVIASAIFTKSTRCADHKEYKRLIKFSTGTFKNRKMGDKRVTIDSRPKFWYTVSMDEYMTILSRERKKYPKEDPNLGGKRHPMNDMYKLIINTTYGVTASSFFDISHPTVGNNITARARAFGWYFEKSCLALGIITDGSVFDLNSVVYPIDRSINGENRVDVRGVSDGHFTLKPIGGLPFKYSHKDDGKHWFYRGDELISQEDLQNWLNNSAVIEHMRKCFSDKILALNIDWVDTKFNVTPGKYEIDSESKVNKQGYFDWEMKGIYESVTIHGASNYSLDDFSGKSKTKMRSYNDKTQWNIQGEVVSSAPQMFLQSLKESIIPVPEPVYQTEIIKLGAWKHQQDKFTDNGLYPGDSIIKVKWIRPLSLSQFNFETIKQMESWKKLKLKSYEKHGWFLEGLYLTEDGLHIEYDRMIEDVYQMVQNGVVDPLKELKLSIDDIPRNPHYDLYLKMRAQVQVVKKPVILEVCPKCGSHESSKAGKRNGKSRLKCKSCGATYTSKLN